MSTDLGPDLFREALINGWRHDRQSGPAQALIDSPPVAMPPARNQYVLDILRDCARHLRLPRSLLVHWRQGAPGAAVGATSHDSQTGELAIYLDANIPTMRLATTIKHEAMHVAHLHTGRSRFVLIEEEEEACDAYAMHHEIPETLKR